MATCIALIIPVVYAVQTYFNRHKEKPMEYLIILLAVGLFGLERCTTQVQTNIFYASLFLVCFRRFPVPSSSSQNKNGGGHKSRRTET